VFAKRAQKHSPWLTISNTIPLLSNLNQNPQHSRSRHLQHHHHPNHHSRYNSSTASMTPTRALYEFVQYSTLTFIGLGIARLAFPVHCRGCQCERQAHSEGGQAGPSNGSMQQLSPMSGYGFTDQLENRFCNKNQKSAPGIWSSQPVIVQQQIRQ
jgi:hypothetical protein